MINSLKQFLRFVIVGLFNTVIDFSILNLLIILTGLATGLAFSVFKAISFLAAVTNSFLFNKYWTFRDRSRNDVGQFSQFLLVSFVGAAINVSAASIIVNLFHPASSLISIVEYLLSFVSISMLPAQIWANIAAALATLASLIWNFVGYKFIVFKKNIPAES